ncbi:MAG: hypothetical protein DLM52_13370 [Chthoniobacterales bacterium]|nr:MAG: hypothetical protein DLM52_13370 [Chthoniobacterales bacterium]
MSSIDLTMRDDHPAEHLILNLPHPEDESLRPILTLLAPQNIADHLNKLPELPKQVRHTWQAQHGLPNQAVVNALHQEAEKNPEFKKQVQHVLDLYHPTPKPAASASA